MVGQAHTGLTVTQLDLAAIYWRNTKSLKDWMLLIMKEKDDSRQCF